MSKNSTNEFSEFCIQRHDIYCNQKYADSLPYSFHLKMVVSQAYKFKHLFPPKNGKNQAWVDIINSCWGHDLIEDARITYGELGSYVNDEVREIIYLCSENRGRTRADRKNDQFYNELATNRLAVFVKLCDVIANVKYSILENSSMFDKAKKEYPHMKEIIYREEFKEMFDYLEKLFTIN